jgi:hypothetical protein
MIVEARMPVTIRRVLPPIYFVGSDSQHDEWSAVAVVASRSLYVGSANNRAAR